MTTIIDQGDLKTLEEELKRLKVAYERYFLGLDPRAPSRDHDRFKKRLRQAQGEQSHNTRRRFRLQALQSSLITYENHWNRVCRQIEEGTYRRHQMLARRRRSSDSAGVDSPGGRSQRDREAATSTTTSSQDEGTADQAHGQIAALHRDYVAAQRQLGLDKLVPINALSRTVEKQTAAIKEQYKCSSVQFRVAVKDGRVILKAVPK